MFGVFTKRIPAPEHSRQELVKRLKRCASDPAAEMMALMMGLDPHDLPREMLMQGAPEASILRIVEQFLVMRDQGATEDFAVKTLNHMHASMLSMAGGTLPELHHTSTLFQYVRHFVDTVHGQENPMSDRTMIHNIQEMKHFYSRARW